MEMDKIRSIIGWTVVGICTIIVSLFLFGVLPGEKRSRDNIEQSQEYRIIQPTPQALEVEERAALGETPEQAPEETQDEAAATLEDSTAFDLEEEASVPAVLTYKPVAAPKIRYDVALTLYDDMKRLHGAMKVYYTNTSANDLYELVFHLHPNAFRHSDSVGSSAESRSYPSMTFSSGQTIVSSVSVNSRLAYHTVSDDGLILRVPFTTELKPGGEVELILEFAVDVPVMNARFGYTELGYQLGNFLPVLAVYQDGAWVEDTYQDKGDSFYSEAADYAVAIKYPEAYTLACTGKIIREEASGGMKTSTAQASGVRDFACMLAKGMRFAEESFKNVRILSYALSEASALNGARIAKEALTVYDELIGEYPYDTLTVAQAELHSAGGMEYSTFIMVQRALYLSGKEVDLHYTIYHETAHQYFFSLVGSDQINAPWIDEAITTYFAILPFERYNPRTFEQLKKTLFYDRADDGTRMDLALSGYENPTEYAASIYWRGGAMYDTLRKELGDEAFFAAVKSYVSAHEYRIAVKQDIIHAFEKAGDRDLEQFFYEWLGGAG